jgi:hypothetical protein
MLKFGKVATPLTVATVVAPERVAAAGLAPIATVTLKPGLATVFPASSCTLTCTAGFITAPALVILLGWTMKPRLVACDDALPGPLGWLLEQLTKRRARLKDAKRQPETIVPMVRTLGYRNTPRRF